MPQGDAGDIPPSSCGMPIAVQMQRLRDALAAAGIGDLAVVSAELADLDEGELQSAIDAVVACEPSPLVLLGGRIVCSGAVEIPLILDSISSGGL